MSELGTGGVESGDFGLARCRECGRDVLTYPDWEGAAEIRRCLHCDERLGGELRWVDAADLAALGYAVEDPEGAGGGCATCTSGGCSKP